MKKSAGASFTTATTYRQRRGWSSARGIAVIESGQPRQAAGGLSSNFFSISCRRASRTSILIFKARSLLAVFAPGCECGRFGIPGKGGKPYTFLCGGRPISPFSSVRSTAKSFLLAASVSIYQPLYYILPVATATVRSHTGNGQAGCRSHAECEETLARR